MLRKILRVETKGSRATRDLAPILSSTLPPGVNLRVLEYGSGDAVVEVYGSDHSTMNFPINQGVLEVLRQDPCVIEELGSHPKAGGYEILIALRNVTEHDPVKKTAWFRGKTFSYLRRKTVPKGDEMLVIDEG